MAKGGIEEGWRSMEERQRRDGGMGEATRRHKVGTEENVKKLSMRMPHQVVNARHKSKCNQITLVI